MDRASAYKFLDTLIEKNSYDSISLLKDIIVDYCFFPNGDTHLSDFEKVIVDYLAEDRKIEAIKFVREKHKTSLKEAKDFVEQHPWPKVSLSSLDLQKRYVERLVAKIKADYNMKE